MSKTKPSKKAKSHGGARAKSGRKPVADKKVSFTFYVEQSILNSNGDIDELKKDCYDFLKQRAEKRTTND
jgi:hypothetical protein